MEQWSGLDKLMAPAFDSELGVLVPEIDGHSFFCFVWVGGRRVRVSVDYAVGWLEESVLRARRATALLPRLMGELWVVSARQNRESWFAENLEDEETPIGCDVTRGLLPLHSVWVSDDEEPLGMELYHEMMGLWSNHVVRTWVDEQGVDSSF